MSKYFDTQSAKAIKLLATEKARKNTLESQQFSGLAGRDPFTFFDIDLRGYLTKLEAEDTYVSQDELLEIIQTAVEEDLRKSIISSDGTVSITFTEDKKIDLSVANIYDLLKLIDDELGEREYVLIPGTGIAIERNDETKQTTITCTLDDKIFVFVSLLPTENIDPEKIYCVKRDDVTEEDNIFDEWHYIEEDQTWELIGSFRPETDLADYYTKEQIDLICHAINKFITALQEAIDTKQDKLTPGVGIDITDNIISAAVSNVTADGDAILTLKATPNAKDPTIIEITGIVDTYSKNEIDKKFAIAILGGTITLESYLTKAEAEQIYVASETVRTIVVLTKDEYDKLETKDSSIMYVISDENSSVYITRTEADELYQPKGDYALKSNIPSLDDYITKETIASTYLTLTQAMSITTNIALKSSLTGKNEYLTFTKYGIKTIDEGNIEYTIIDEQEVEFKTINGEYIIGSGNISTAYTAGTGISITNNTISCTLDTTIFTIVLALPTTGINTNTIYVVPADETSENNKYNEYIYIYAEQRWELVGTLTGSFDLSNYLTKTSFIEDIIVYSLRLAQEANIEYKADNYTLYLTFPAFYQDTSTVDPFVYHTQLPFLHINGDFVANPEAQLLYVPVMYKVDTDYVTLFNIPSADTARAGVMTANDKSHLDDLWEAYDSGLLGGGGDVNLSAYASKDLLVDWLQALANNGYYISWHHEAGDRSLNFHTAYITDAGGGITSVVRNQLNFPVVESDDIINIKVLTSAEYNALGTKDSNTMYCITD